MEHIAKQLDQAFICTCGLEFQTMSEAMNHTEVFDNTPNPVRLFEALQAGRSTND